MKSVIKPKAPLIRIIYDYDLCISMCPKCGSSLKSKWIFFKSNKCIQPECENYYGNSIG